MSFWKLNHPAGSLAAVDAATERQKTYAELRDDVSGAVDAFPKSGHKLLVFLLAQNRYECLVAYLAALNAGHALLLADAGTNSELMSGLIQTYTPDLILSAGTITVPGYNPRAWDGLSALRAPDSQAAPLHDALALLLNTSGSTGSPKLVRLSYGNLQSNAESIRQYLQLTSADRPITSLPMSYSYGLSVINSHLLAAAPLIMTDYGILRREFWDCIDRFACTSISGVPYTYQMLLQTGLLQKRGASLRTLTQAGGALAPEHIRKVHQLALQRDLKFFVMYGQTEATARISYVPFEKLGEKVGSIGAAIPGGSLQVDPATGELVYNGPNVMMGYAESREDLGRGDDLRGNLRTGDLARQDGDGFFYITGRLKRFLKLFGKRFSLDEVEQILQERCMVPVACFGCDDMLMVAIETTEDLAAGVARIACETFSLPSSVVQIRTMPRLPRNARGKTDYSALQDFPLSASETPANNEVLGGRSSLA